MNYLGGVMKKMMFYLAVAGVSAMLVGCQELGGPAGTVATAAEIAQQLGFNFSHVSVENLEVRPRIAIPVANSGVDVDLALVVQNPLNIQINTQSFSGALGLEQNGVAYSLGNVGTRKAAAIPPKTRGSVPLTLRLSYQDVKDSWAPITNAVSGQASVWKLNGTLEVNLGGTILPVPVSISKAVN
jgi:LEA14-like dessication related protein